LRTVERVRVAAKAPEAPLFRTKSAVFARFGGGFPPFLPDIHLGPRTLAAAVRGLFRTRVH